MAAFQPKEKISQTDPGAHNLTRLLRFLSGVRLALGCDLLFLRWLLKKNPQG
jgi:hypothetical protein